MLIQLLFLNNVETSVQGRILITVLNTLRKKGLNCTFLYYWIFCAFSNLLPGKVHVVYLLKYCSKS